MISIPVNENIDNYKNTVIAGLNFRQTIAMIVSVAVGVIEYLILYLALSLPSMVCALIILPSIFVFGTCIIYTKDGLNLFEIIKTGRFKKQIEFISFYSTEMSEVYSNSKSIIKTMTFEEEEAKREEEFNKLAKKIITCAIVGAILLVAVAVGIIVYFS